MFDEMDGKQARKTKNGSGLGLFFDHGCDAFSVGLVTILCTKTVSNGNNLLSMMNLATCITSFHLATLEEYYIGSLVLPACNGVSDGSIAVILFFIISGIFGPEFWSYQLLESPWMPI
jgi:ethanolaminephosphotransferase